MDYALTQPKTLDLETLEEIKKALINDKKFYANEEILEGFINSLRNVTDATKAYLRRKPIATANGIKNYSGTAAQNNKIIKLAKDGKLRRV